MQWFLRLESSPRQRTFLIALILLVFGIGFLSRLSVGASLQYPGYADTTYYFEQARNLVSGRGFQVDWFFTYLGKPATIADPRSYYWMPLSSIIMALSMLVGGQSLLAAIIPAILAGLAVAFLAYVLAMLTTGSRFVALSSAGLILFVPELFGFSTRTDCVIYYVFFATLSLVFMIKGRTQPRFFLVSSFFAALTYLTRSDGVLLIPTLLVVILLARQRWTARLAWMIAAVGLFILVVSPLLISNYRIFGSPFSPLASKTMFMTSPNDYDLFGNEPTLQTYLQHGVRFIASLKFRAAVYYVQTLFSSLPNFLGIFALLGMIGLFVARRGKLGMWSPYLIHLALVVFSFTVVFTIPGIDGGFERCVMADVPFFIVIAVECVHALITSKPAVMAIILLVIGLLMNQAIAQTRSVAAYWNNIGTSTARIAPIIANDASAHQIADTDTDIVVMASEPWIVHQATGYKSVPLPGNADGKADAISKIAEKYAANYLVLGWKVEQDDTLLPLTQPSSASVYGIRLEFVDCTRDSTFNIYRIATAAPDL